MLSLKLIHLISLILISSAFIINIKDENYVEAQIGYPPKAVKLMIDITGPYTYIFTDVESQTEKTNNQTESFKNIFGSFEGEWKSDFFYLTEDKIFNFRMDYIQITKKNTKLDCDGVLGLGYSSKYKDGNIYEVLKNMPNVVKNEKKMSFDKKSQQIYLGENLGKTPTYNPHVFNIYENDKMQGTFIKLTNLVINTDKDWKVTLEKIPINDDALLTLMPVVVAPKHRETFLYDNYLPKITNANSQIENKQDDKKFFSDFYISDPNTFVNTEIGFDYFVYPFKSNYEDKNGQKRVQLRLGNIKDHELEHWYVGSPVLQIDRMDFNYEENTVKIYSNKCYDILEGRYTHYLRCVLACIAFTVIFTLFLRYFFYKPHPSEVSKEEELVNL